MAFDGKSLYPSAMVDKDSFYPRIETGFLFTPNRETELIQKFRNRTQFKDQASAILRVKFYNTENLIFEHLPVKEDFFLDGNRYKHVNRSQIGYITEILTNVDIDEIVIMGGNICNIYEGIIYLNNTSRFHHLNKS